MMNIFKRFSIGSVFTWFAGKDHDPMNHLEDYLLKDIGMERVNGRILPIEKELSVVEMGILPKSDGRSEEPPL